MIDVVSKELLAHGLDDWVPLTYIHGAVNRADPGQSAASLKQAVLSKIGELATDGYFEIGWTPPEAEGWVPWDSTIGDSLSRISEEYNAIDDVSWYFCCWLKITERGKELAERIEAEEDGE
ncbi:MAG: hypothetical protein ACRDUS_06915 [Mycobacterium sp.]